MRNADDEECDHRVPFARDVSAWAAESAADADSATAVREAFETAAASNVFEYERRTGGVQTIHVDNILNVFDRGHFTRTF